MTHRNYETASLAERLRTSGATVAELLAKVSALKPGRPARLKFLRNNQELEFSVTPAQRPRVKSVPR